MDLQILIPSRSRPNSMVTPFQIPRKYHNRVSVYVAQEQFEEYQNYYLTENNDFQLVSVSTLNDLLGRKLYLMAKDVDSEYIMLCDDDFTFFTRIEPDEFQLRKMFQEDWDRLFLTIEDKFKQNPNLYGVGVSMRQGNNRISPEGNNNSRLNGCIVYKRELFLSAEHDRVNPMNDFDVNLQLLRRGYDNFLISQFCYNQPGTQSPGGSSDYRTEETQKEAAHKLAEMHPEFVRLRTKVNKTGGLRERTEVTVQWKKARQSANLKESNNG